MSNPATQIIQPAASAQFAHDPNATSPTVAAIVAAVARAARVEPSALTVLTTYEPESTVMARYLAMTLAIEMTDQSMADIARHFQRGPRTAANAQRAIVTARNRQNADVMSWERAARQDLQREALAAIATKRRPVGCRPASPSVYHTPRGNADVAPADTTHPACTDGWWAENDARFRSAMAALGYIPRAPKRETSWN